MARRQAHGREQEEAFLRDQLASMEGSSANPWARVCDLVDLKGSVVPRRTSGTGKRDDQLGAGLDEDNVFRATEKMRSLIIQVRARLGLPAMLGAKGQGSRCRTSRLPGR